MDVVSLKALVAALLTWINLHGGYEVPDGAPVVALVPHATLEQMGCSGPCPILGWYSDTGVVYVDRALALKTNVCARSILLHELVHFYQDRDGRFVEFDKTTRWQMRELEAHELQTAFLAENGVRAGMARSFAVRAFMGPSC